METVHSLLHIVENKHTHTNTNTNTNTNTLLRTNTLTLSTALLSLSGGSLHPISQVPQPTSWQLGNLTTTLYTQRTVVSLALEGTF